MPSGSRSDGPSSGPERTDSIAEPPLVPPGPPEEGNDRRPRGADGPIVFVSDPTAEAERVARALRAGGYTVVDVPLSMLVARVAVQHPGVVLVDADSHGALDVVSRMRELPQADDVHVVFIAAPGGTISTLEEALAHEGSGLWLRPIDVGALVRQVESLSGGASTHESDRGRSSTPPPSIVNPASGKASSPGSRPPANPRGTPFSAGFSETVSFSEPPMPASRIPAPKAMTLAPPVSAELQRLLTDAEKRVEIPADEDVSPSPEQEIEAVLPADLLAALDEPLDDDDEADAELPRPATSLAPGTRERTTDGGASRTTGASTGGGATPHTPRGGRRGPTVSETPAPAPLATQAPTESPVSSHPGANSQTAPPGRVDTVYPDGMSHALPEPARNNHEHAPRGSPSDSFMPDSSGALAADESDASPATEIQGGPEGATSFGEAIRVVGRAIGARTSGALCVMGDRAPVEGEGYSPGIVARRVVLQDGDVVTCASTVDDESLIAFLGVRGDLPRETVRRLSPKFPRFGRHAGAALVARGYLLQEQMWPTLRAHAEWVLGRVLQVQNARVTMEVHAPGRLASEPSVFGGATGAEVFVEIVRRVVSPTEAVERLGGGSSRLAQGPFSELIDECALAGSELAVTRAAGGRTLAEVIADSPDVDFASALFALVHLGIIETLRSAEDANGEGADADPAARAIDAEAVRERVRARMQLVEDGDYFAVLGVPRDATGYEVRRAFLELRRAFDPSRMLSAGVADLTGDVQKITSVLDEAYEILKDGARRERYRRAIEGAPRP